LIKKGEALANTQGFTPDIGDTIPGGFGSAVLEAMEEARATDSAYRDVAVRIVGIPGDRFVDHGSVADLRRMLRLDAAGLEAQVREALATLGVTPGRPEVAPAG